MKKDTSDDLLNALDRRQFLQSVSIGGIALSSTAEVGRPQPVAFHRAGATATDQHSYQGTLGIYYLMVDNYGANDTEAYLKWINKDPAWFHNPGFDILKQQGGTIYSIEQPDRLAKVLRTMRRATADVMVVDSVDTHTDPWSSAMHYFADALENQPADEKQLKWLYWLELWSTDRYGPEWYGPRWTRYKSIGAPYQSWEQTKQVIDYIWDNFAERPHYYRWNGKPMIVIEADRIEKVKPDWYERIMADERFYAHFVCDVVHDLKDYPSTWTDWVWPYWVDVQPTFNPEWDAALEGTAGAKKHQLEALFDKRTGKSPMGGNSEPPQFIFIPAYNDYVAGRNADDSAWFEPFFDEDGNMSRFEYVDSIPRALGRRPSSIALDTEGKKYSLQPTINKLTALLQDARQNHGLARVVHIAADEYSPGGLDVPVLTVELYPYRGYEASKSFDTIVSMSIRNIGTAEIGGHSSADIENVWLIHESALEGTRTRVGRFVPHPWNEYRNHGHGLLRWVGQYPIRFKDKLFVALDLTENARSGRTMQFELVVDEGTNARAVEFALQCGSERFSPIRTVLNKYPQVIR